jgi:hypothetical protein
MEMHNLVNYYYKLSGEPAFDGNAAFGMRGLSTAFN